MALREKFGRLVLLDETDTSPLGNEYRAARLGASGFDRLVTVLRFSERVSAHADATRRLVEQARIAAQVHSPGLVKMLGVGRVGAVHYLSTELVEGRSVSAVLLACRENGFPFGADHSLMIASRAAAGLEALAGRKGDDGQPLFHGLVAPRQLAVAFDGDVKVKGLGLWPALGQTDLLAPEERAYLAPEQAAGQGDARSDVYSLGLVLLEMVSGTAPHGGDAQTLVAGARIAAPGGEPGPLPKPLADLLRRALAADPAARFKGVSELRRGIDALLFSGDFTPTTFDLAFFMHTLFRDEVERDARAVEEASRADYREFLAEEGAKTAPASPAQGAPGAEVHTAAGPAEAHTATANTAPPLATEPAARAGATAPPPRTVPATGPDASSPRIAARPARESASREAAAREAAGRLSLGGGAAAPRRGLGRSAWLGIGVIAAALVGGGAGWLYFVSRRGAAATAAPSAEQAAAEARVRELEARIAELETEKAAAETRAAEDARATVEKQAAAGGQAADPAAIQRAQDEARLRARQEQERRQQEELQRLADEKRAEEQRLAAAAAAALAATPSPTPLATPPPGPAPSAAPAAPDTSASPAPPAAPAAAVPAPQAGSGPSAASPAPVTQASPGVPVAATAAAPPGRIAPADPADPAVRAPGLVSEDPVPYPRRALAARIGTTIVVVVRALVDETGRVTESSITQASGQPPELGFDEAALKRVRSRKYRPARRHDVPVPMWVLIRVEFRPPPGTR